MANEPFVIGALVLRESLRKQGCAFEFVVALTDSVDTSIERRLNSLGVRTVRVTYQAPDNVLGTDTKAHRWNVTLAKLGVLDLNQFSKLVFLDADTIALANLDSLFEFQHVSAVRSRAPLQPGGNTYGFNSGVMVIEPAMAAALDINSAHARVHNRHQMAERPYGDQDVLNEAFPHWHSDPKRQLPDGYNVFFGSLDKFVRQSGVKPSSDQHCAAVRLVHFTGPHKPWERRAAFGAKAIIRSPRHHRSPPTRATFRVLADYWRTEARVRRAWKYT